MSPKIFTTTVLTTTTLLAIAVAMPASAQDERSQARANFQSADVNQDQQLDFDEFKTFVNLNADHNLGRASMIRRFGMHARAFGKLDANGDGIVTPQEIASKAQR